MTEKEAVVPNEADTIRMHAVVEQEQEPSVQEKPKPNTSARKKRRRWVVLLLRVAKYAGIPIVCFVALFIGLTIGYVYIGGGDGADVTHLGTWKHAFDLIFAP